MGCLYNDKKISTPTPRQNVQLRCTRCRTLPIKGGRTLAFTLAETLITLVIIGVVAALTVPTMLIKYQKEETVTRLKKAYSSLAQTTQRAIADNGPILTWEIGTKNDPIAAKDFFNKYLTPYLQIMGEVKTYSECNPVKIYFLSGVELNDNMEYYSKFYLSDGTSVVGKIINDSETAKELVFYLDINGDKKPNKMGRDIFQFYYTVLDTVSQYWNGKFYPTGYPHTREEILRTGSHTCNKNASGAWCGALIMYDGWQIKDDYPW